MDEVCKLGVHGALVGLSGFFNKVLVERRQDLSGKPMIGEKYSSDFTANGLDHIWHLLIFVPYTV